MTTEVKPTRFDQNSIGDKFLQHVPGRVESAAKIVFLAGCAIAQAAKITGKIAFCIAEKFVPFGSISENSRFSLKGIARDCVILGAIFQRTFNEGVCGVIFAQQSRSSKFYATAAEVFDWVYLDSYHHNNTTKQSISGLIETHISAQPSLKELIFDKDSYFAKFFNIFEDRIESQSQLNTSTPEDVFGTPDASSTEDEFKTPEPLDTTSEDYSSTEWVSAEEGDIFATNQTNGMNWEDLQDFEAIIKYASDLGSNPK